MASPNSPEPTLEQMEEALLTAGWKRIEGDLWRSPNGLYYFGPYCAWREMKGRQEADRV